MELYCITCHMEMSSLMEGVHHIIDYGCIVESEPKVKSWSF